MGKARYAIESTTGSPLVKAVQKTLRASPDLLGPNFRERNPNTNPLAGHCYVASELLYHMLGGKDGPWRPTTVRHEGVTHWFLRCAEGRILDATAEQFDTPPPYQLGRGRGFLTREPSKRTSEAMLRLALDGR